VPSADEAGEISASVLGVNSSEEEHVESALGDKELRFLPRALALLREALLREGVGGIKFTKMNSFVWATAAETARAASDAEAPKVKAV